TVLADTPLARAIERVLQCVALFGLLLVVNRTISSTVLRGMLGLRPDRPPCPTSQNPQPSKVLR
ncbi:MAG TPA: hypothetical protein VJ901_13790, partial [Thermoanaerobaculia bacterium]|nr:hypothetical protein [Thermoanaerobaculia bacterium]